MTTTETADRTNADGAEGAAGPDGRPPAAGAPRIVEIQPGDRAVRVRWEDGRVARFHHIWLRDNCACPDCRHPQTRERTVAFIGFPEDFRPARAELTARGALRLHWAAFDGSGDEHESLFEADWLRRHAYDASSRAERRRQRIAFWGGELGRDLPGLDHREVMETEEGLCRWLRILETTGVALIRNAPPREGEVLRIAERVGPPRVTNFGLHFDVLSKPSPNNSAYTAMGLELHTDLPNYRRPPDYQLLFCLANEAAGGASILADGFRAAEALRAAEPEAFRLLATTPIDFRFHDAADDLPFRAPVIGLDPDGEIAEIRFNNWIRGVLDLPEERMEPLYAAYRRFWELLRDPAGQARFRLNAGEMIAFDNLRVLHGREAFDPGTGRRHLQGTYLDRDFVVSRRRVLERRLAAAAAPAIEPTTA